MCLRACLRQKMRCYLDRSLWFHLTLVAWDTPSTRQQKMIWVNTRLAHVHLNILNSVGLQFDTAWSNSEIKLYVFITQKLSNPYPSHDVITFAKTNPLPTLPHPLSSQFSSHLQCLGNTLIQFRNAAALKTWINWVQLSPISLEEEGRTTIVGGKGVGGRWFSLCSFYISV